MKLITSIEAMRSACREIRSPREGTRGDDVGLVPTMGALHAGHLSLVRAAKAHGDAVVVSIFVNPKQFGPTEDLATYPRTPERDSEALEAEGVDFLFTPAASEMYPDSFSTTVSVEGLNSKLCGRSRPGHFQGVTTVVSKLFNIVQPRRAYFGQKDAAQVAIVRWMVSDLNLPVEVVVCPIVREPDGLAVSSRNLYLDAIDRRRAAVLYRALQRIRLRAEEGLTNAPELLAEGYGVFAQEPRVKVEYIAVVDQNSLDPVEDVREGALVAVAALVGSTRLIDNIVLPPAK